jgi:hypothetical protein
MKIFIIFLISISQLNCQRPMKPGEDLSKYSAKFRGIECLSTDNSTAAFKFCYVKNYSRKMSTLNFGIEIQRKIQSIYIQLVASFRYGNIYREIVDTKLLNWCQIMDGADYNLFFKFILDIIRQSIPGLFHKCPYEGTLELNNITMFTEDALKITVFPEGQYKYNITISDRPDRVVLILVVYTEIRSPVKNSWG